MVESARAALIQSDYSSLQTFVPEAAKTDSDVAALYVITDNGFVAAHSDPRLKEKPVSEVDPQYGPELAQITKPLAKQIEITLPERGEGLWQAVRPAGDRAGQKARHPGRHLQPRLAAAAAERASRKASSSRARSTWFRSALIGLLFILVAAGIAVFQGLRITQPLKLLAWRADQIARGDLSTRVEVNSADEIGMLGENFNYMADRLQVLLRRDRRQGDAGERARGRAHHSRDAGADRAI